MSVVSPCFEDESGNLLQFHSDISIKRRLHDESVQFCLDSGFEHAMLKSASLTAHAHDFLENEMDEALGDFQDFFSSFWVGLTREDPADPFDPKSFRFLDGTEVDDFASVREEFPWDSTLPGFQQPKERNCVTTVFPRTFVDPTPRWFDDDCVNPFQDSYPLCISACVLPTAQPTEVMDEELDLGVVIGATVPAVALVAIVGVLIAYFVVRNHKHSKDDFALSYEERAMRDKEVFQKNQDALDFSRRDLTKEDKDIVVESQL